MSNMYDQPGNKKLQGDLDEPSSKTPEYSDSPLYDEEFVADKIRHFRNKHRRRWFPKMPSMGVIMWYISLCSTFFTISFLFGMKYAQSWPELGALKRAYSPLSEALVPEQQMFNLKERTNNYINKPSPEVDATWTEILKYSNVRLTEEEVDEIDPERKQSSIPLPDGGYFGMITVFHELHCIRKLYMFIYSDYYMAEYTTEELGRRRLHMEHCLDLVRQSIMCHADVTPITMKWAHTVPVPGANYSAPHNCYNWDAVNNWAKSRSIDRIFEPGYLKHPTFGDVYSWKGYKDLAKVGLATDHDDDA